VLGEVQHPGAQPLTPELNLRLAISQAGGLADGAGSSPTIQIVQTATNKTIHLSWKDLMSPHGGDEVTLHPGDMVYIPKSGFSKVATVITKLSPLATLVTLGALLQ
jgi:protein involved in polysaccharide export with SLBB domain